MVLPWKGSVGFNLPTVNIRIIMEKKLKKVTITSTKALEKAQYVPTQLVVATVEGQSEPKYWEMINGHDSVHALIINRETEEIIVVKQVRIPFLVNKIKEVTEQAKIAGINDSTLQKRIDKITGEVVECAAGLVDKNIPIDQIVKEEILEECGYDAPLEAIKALKVLRSSVGTQGTRSYTYIVEVDESMKVNEGGGLPEEDIAVIRIKFEDVYSWLFEEENDTDAVTSFLLTYFMFMDINESF